MYKPENKIEKEVTNKCNPLESIRKVYVLYYSLTELRIMKQYVICSRVKVKLNLCLTN
jgi:hypothetical protein